MSRTNILGRVIIAVLAACISLHAQSPPADSSSLLQDAGQALAAGDLQTAEQKLQWILRKSPEDYRALDLLGIVRAQQQRNSEAENIFERVIKNHSDYASAHINLGLLYMQMAEPDQAAPQLEEGLRLAPDRTDAASALASILRDQARAAVSSGDGEKALSLLLRARKLQPSDPDVLFDLGMVALRMSLLPDALEAFQQTLKLRGDDAAAIYGLGRTYIELAKFQEARQQFARYVELKHDDATGHYALGLSCADLQLTDEARSEFEKSIALQPAQTESYFRIGLIELDGKHYEYAEQNFQRVLARDPKHAGALAALGRVKLEQKKYDEAVETLQRAIASDDSLREAHYYLGMTYARMGRKDDSDQQFEFATRLEKEATEKQRTLLKILDPSDTAAADTSQH